MRSLIFCAPSFTLPIERIEASWSVKSRKLDKIALYNGVKKAMEDAIVQLEIEEEHDQKQRSIKERYTGQQILLATYFFGSLGHYCIIFC